MRVKDKLRDWAWRETLDRDWVGLTLLFWAVVSIWFFTRDWNQVRYLSLGDTDDNMRLMQVRALLHGQPWYDLRQYRMNPPIGFDIHWSRLVDLPIAALILTLRLFTTNSWAERIACGIAPLLPLSIAMLGLAATVRRLVSRHAWPLALVFLMGTSATMLMFLPERIDHHGWQLAMLSLTVAGLCDPKDARGGAIVGIASAVSLTIGLEMLPFSAGAGAIIALRWIWDRAEARRLSTYALALGGGSALGYAGFASYADRVMRCDALTPVWLSVMIAAGLLLFALAWASPASRAVRLGLAIVAGALIVAGFVHFFPQCLGRPEQVSPELERNWLNNIREAKPITQHPFRTAFPIAFFPVIGLIGAGVAAWRSRGASADRAVGWAAVATFTAFAVAMLFWQVRAGPGAQLLAVPGAVALTWFLVPRLLGSGSMIVRVFGTVAAVVVISGAFVGLTIGFLKVDPPSAYTKRVNYASGNCVRTTILSPLNRYPAQTVFTFIDLGPRLITITHHDAMAGPYHRNGPAILDVQHAFAGTPDQAHAIMAAHGATLLLLCPNMSESTIYRARSRGGFYDQLAHGRTFDWLTPLPLPRGSPLRLFRID